VPNTIGHFAGVTIGNTVMSVLLFERRVRQTKKCNQIRAVFCSVLFSGDTRSANTDISIMTSTIVGFTFYVTRGF